jgi:hypothetical protein
MPRSRIVSQAEEVKVSSETVRFLSREASAIPGGRPRIVVHHKPVGYGLSRMFELLRDEMGGQHHVVWSMDQAYAMLGVTPEDFTERLFPEVVAA